MGELQIRGDVTVTPTGFTAQLRDGRRLVVDGGSRPEPLPVLEPLKSDKHGLEGVGNGLRLRVQRRRLAQQLAHMIAEHCHCRRRGLVERDTERAVRPDALGRVRRVVDVVDHDFSSARAGSEAATSSVPATTVAETTDTIPSARVGDGLGRSGERPSPLLPLRWALVALALVCVAIVLHTRLVNGVAVIAALAVVGFVATFIKRVPLVAEDPDPVLSRLDLLDMAGADDDCPGCPVCHIGDAPERPHA